MEKLLSALLALGNGFVRLFTRNSGPNLASDFDAHSIVTFTVPNGGMRYPVDLPADGKTLAWGYRIRHQTKVAGADANNLHYAIGSPFNQADSLAELGAGNGEYLEPGCATEGVLAARRDRKRQQLLIDLRAVAAFSDPADQTAVCIITIYPLIATGEQW